MSAAMWCADCGNPVEGHDPGECTLRTVDQHLNPECRAKKHGNCRGRGDAWCVIEDESTDCKCDCHPQTASTSAGGDS